MIHHAMNNRNRSVLAVTCCVAVVSGLVVSGCSTYSTLRSDAVKEDGSSEAGKHYGQTYFLPKGLVHLVIKPESGGGGGSSSPTASATVTINGPLTGTIPPKTEANSNDKKGGEPEDDGLKPLAYAIKVDRVLVPDRERGALTARYNTNWFYSETVGIGVDDNGLLATVSSDSSDRSAQVLFNLADTAANIAKFVASSGGGVPLGSVSAKAKGLPAPPDVPAPKSVRYRRLDIDTTFDPFLASDSARVRGLFQTVHSRDTNAVYVAPLRLVACKSAQAEGLVPKTLIGRSPKKEGLWFRELVAFELVFTPNTEEFAAELRDQLSIAQTFSKAWEQYESDISNLEVPLADQPAPLPGQPVVKEKVEIPQALQKRIDAAKAVYPAMRNAYETALAKQTVREQRVNIAIPNPHREFAFNVARSAFVQNKKINLTIKAGLLSKVELVKPSEAEGFSEIPLRLSEKLAALPKDLLSLRVDRTEKLAKISENELNGFNNKSELDQAIALKEAQMKKAQVENELAILKAQVDLLKSRRTLLEEQSGQFAAPAKEEEKK